MLILICNFTYGQELRLITGISSNSIVSNKFIGPIINYRLSYFIGLNKAFKLDKNQKKIFNIGILYNPRRFDFGILGIRTASNISVPVSLQYNLNKNISIDLGPQIDYYFYTKTPFPFKRLSYLINLGLKKRLNNKINLGLKLSHSIDNVYAIDINKKYSSIGVFVEYYLKN
jgi:hypothetical protein